MVRRCVILATLLSWVVLGVPAYAGKEGKVSISKEIQKEKKTLESLKGKIDLKKQQAKKAEKKRKSVLQSLQQLDRRLVSSRKKRRVADRQLKEKDEELETIVKQLEQVKSSIQERQGSIQARLRTLYTEGRFGYVKALLSVKNPNELHRRFHYLSTISQQEFALHPLIRT